MAKREFEREIFWKDGFMGDAQGGLHFRSFDLNKFMEGIEERGGRVVGIQFSGNNCEIICETRNTKHETNTQEESTTVL